MTEYWYLWLAQQRLEELRREAERLRLERSCLVAQKPSASRRIAAWLRLPVGRAT